MVRDAFDDALSGFGQWTKTAELRGDPAESAVELRLLTGLMRDNLDLDRPADLCKHDLAELLLLRYPNVVPDPESVPRTTVPALHDFIAYLADSGQVWPSAAHALATDLDMFAAQLTDGVTDPRRWEAARDLLGMMTHEGAGLYEADEGDEDVDLKEAFGLPDELPPIRLPDEAELARMARSAPMIGQLLALAHWVGAGREVDEDGDLAADGQAEAAAAAGVPVDQFVYLWEVAFESGFIELDVDDEELVIPGEVAEDWADSDDADVFDTWALLLGTVLVSTEEVAAELDEELSAELDFAGSGPGLAVMLFLARGYGVPVTEASEIICGGATGELQPDEADLAWQSWLSAHGDPTRLLLDQLSVLGAVEVTQTEEDGDVARLTPLGLAAMRDQFVESGVEIPLLPPPDQMTAGDLLAMAFGAPEEELMAELQAWKSHRTSESAARDMLSAAVDADAASRMLAVSIVTEIGAPAQPAWRDAMGQLPLRGYAKSAMAMQAGDGVLPDLSNEDIAWMFTDSLAMDGWDDTGSDAEHDPVALVTLLQEAIGSGLEPVFEEVARIPHPQAADVLTVIGKVHPDKGVAKAARKAAYKASTRQASRRI
jgi:hypothetical protein